MAKQINGQILPEGVDPAKLKQVSPGHWEDTDTGNVYYTGTDFRPDMDAEDVELAEPTRAPSIVEEFQIQRQLDAEKEAIVAEVRAEVTEEQKDQRKEMLDQVSQTKTDALPEGAQNEAGPEQIEEAARKAQTENNKAQTDKGQADKAATTDEPLAS